jgi:hypothetical protein
MLSNTLNTNEVKNSAGTEVEFSRLSTNGRDTVFAQIAETPNAPHRLQISHQEIGAGANLRRRSRVTVSKTVTGVSGVPRVITATTVMDIPVGDVSSLAESTHVLAELVSFIASLGASTTILYDGTGNGAVALLNGGL